MRPLCLQALQIPDYRPLPGQLGNMTMFQVHTLESLKKQLKAEGKFVEERMDDAALLRHVTSFVFSKISFRDTNIE
jgi:hypothetical protein